MCFSLIICLFAHVLFFPFLFLSVCSPGHHLQSAHLAAIFYLTLLRFWKSACLAFASYLLWIYISRSSLFLKYPLPVCQAHHQLSFLDNRWNNLPWTPSLLTYHLASCLHLSNSDILWTNFYFYKCFSCVNCINICFTSVKSLLFTKLLSFFVVASLLLSVLDHF